MLAGSCGSLHVVELLLGLLLALLGDVVLVTTGVVDGAGTSQ